MVIACLRSTSRTARRSSGIPSSGRRPAGERGLDRSGQRRRCEEDKLVERLLGIAVPTREEMQEIEVSSRLYVENHARYMTATLMCNPTRRRRRPRRSPSSFPATSSSRCATTIRARSRLSSTSSPGHCPAKVTGETVLMDLLDAVIDRAADILERIGAGGRPGVARHLRAGGRGRARRPTRTCSRRSAARAT